MASSSTESKEFSKMPCMCTWQWVTNNFWSASIRRLIGSWAKTLPKAFFSFLKTV